jgi:hypothetical protein
MEEGEAAGRSSWSTNHGTRGACSGVVEDEEDEEEALERQRVARGTERVTRTARVHSRTACIFLCVQERRARLWPAMKRLTRSDHARTERKRLATRVGLESWHVTPPCRVQSS